MVSFERSQLSTAPLIHNPSTTPVPDFSQCVRQEAVNSPTALSPQRVIPPEETDTTERKVKEMDEMELWDEAQTAEWLHVAAKTLKNWRSLREGPMPTYIGRRACYLRSDVVAWVQEQRSHGDAWRLS